MLTDDAMPGAVRRPVAPGPARPPVRRPVIRRLLVLLLVAAVLLALVRGLLLQSFVVPTGSMEPTVRAGDRVLAWRPPALTGHVRRGDVVVFDGAGVFGPQATAPRDGLARVGRPLAAALGMPVGAADYVKRVIGLPGDRVACCDRAGRVTVNGAALDEPYLYPGDAPSTTRFDTVVPPGRLWLLGDHRSASADSRAHLGDPGGGTVAVARVVGRVVGVYWPPSHRGGLKGEGER